MLEKQKRHGHKAMIHIRLSCEYFMITKRFKVIALPRSVVAQGQWSMLFHSFGIIILSLLIGMDIWALPSSVFHQFNPYLPHFFHDTMKVKDQIHQLVLYHYGRTKMVVVCNYPVTKQNSFKKAIEI